MCVCARSTTTSSLKKFLEIHTHTVPAINPQQIQIVSPLAYSTTVVAVVVVAVVVSVLVLRTSKFFNKRTHCATKKNRKEKRDFLLPII